MDFVCLGNSGLKVSRLCLGCMSYGSSKARAWILDEEAALPFYQQAIEAGINFFDAADAYADGQSEQMLGRALEGLPRDSYCLVGAVGHDFYKGERQGAKGYPRFTATHARPGRRTSGAQRGR